MVGAASGREADPKAEVGVEILVRAVMEKIGTQPRTPTVVASHRPPSTEPTRCQRPQRYERGSKVAPYAISVPQPWALDSQYLRIVHRPRGFPSPITSPEGFASGPLAEWLSHGHERGTPTPVPATLSRRSRRLELRDGIHAWASSIDALSAKPIARAVASVDCVASAQCGPRRVVK